MPRKPKMINMVDYKRSVSRKLEGAFPTDGIDVYHIIYDPSSGNIRIMFEINPRAKVL